MAGRGRRDLEHLPRTGHVFDRTVFQRALLGEFAPDRDRFLNGLHDGFEKTVRLQRLGQFLGHGHERLQPILAGRQNRLDRGHEVRDRGGPGQRCGKGCRHEAKVVSHSTDSQTLPVEPIPLKYSSCPAATLQDCGNSKFPESSANIGTPFGIRAGGGEIEPQMWLDYASSKRSTSAWSSSFVTDRSETVALDRR